MMKLREELKWDVAYRVYIYNFEAGYKELLTNLSARSKIIMQYTPNFYFYKEADYFKFSHDGFWKDGVSLVSFDDAVEDSYQGAIDISKRRNLRRRGSRDVDYTLTQIENALREYEFNLLSNNTANASNPECKPVRRL